MLACDEIRAKEIPSSFSGRIRGKSHVCNFLVLLAEKSLICKSSRTANTQYYSEVPFSGKKYARIHTAEKSASNLIAFSRYLCESRHSLEHTRKRRGKVSLIAKAEFARMNFSAARKKLTV